MPRSDKFEGSSDPAPRTEYKRVSEDSVYNPSSQESSATRVSQKDFDHSMRRVNGVNDRRGSVYFVIDTNKIKRRNRKIALNERLEKL